jgi:hypothetical protein
VGAERSRVAAQLVVPGVDLDASRQAIASLRVWYALVLTLDNSQIGLEDQLKDP